MNYLYLFFKMSLPCTYHSNKASESFFNVFQLHYSFSSWDTAIRHWGKTKLIFPLADNDIILLLSDSLPFSYAGRMVKQLCFWGLAS